MYGPSWLTSSGQARSTRNVNAPAATAASRRAAATIARTRSGIGGRKSEMFPDRVTVNASAGDDIALPSFEEVNRSPGDTGREWYPRQRAGLCDDSKERPSKLLRRIQQTASSNIITGSRHGIVGQPF